jgi:predicted transcriptional regulator
MSTKKTNGQAHGKRVTFVLPDVIDRALEQHCSVTNRPKHVVAAEAITAYLTEHREELMSEMQAVTEQLLAGRSR